MIRRFELLPILGICLLGAPAVAQTAGQPLTPEQVACEERQLERLQHRMWVNREGSSLFLWRASASGGLYRGLASTAEIGPDLTGHPSRTEDQLAFDLVLKTEEDLLDPLRPRRPQTTLARRDVASNLVSAPNNSILDLTLDLAPESGDPSIPRLPIHVTNRLAAEPSADDRAGRGVLIDDLLRPCHAEVSEFDLQVFAILARTLRPSQCLAARSTCDAALERYKTVFFRGAEPLTYRVNVYPNLSSGAVDARVAFLLRLQPDGAGRLIGGEIHALPWCTGAGQVGCTFAADAGFALFILPPLRPGIDRQGEEEFHRAAHLNLEYDGSPYNILQDTVNWLDLLRDTAWNERLAPAITGSVDH